MKKTVTKNRNLKLLADVKFAGKSKAHIVSFIDDGCIYLFNSQHVFLELDKIQRCFFDFLCEKMSFDNTIHIDGDLKSLFVAFLDKITGGKKKITTRTISNYVKILIDKKLLIEATNFKMLYIINAKYVYKGSKKNRKKILQTLLKNPNKYGSDNYALLDLPKSLIVSSV